MTDLITASTVTTPNTDTAAPASTAPGKHRVQSITLYRAEGPTSELQREREVAVRGASAWLDARLVLLRWSATAPKGGAYDKVDFTVTWETGDTYEGQFDLHREGTFDLGEHIRLFQGCYGGVARPGHLSEKRYAEFLAQCTTPEMRARCVAFLEAYATE